VLESGDGKEEREVMRPPSFAGQGTPMQPWKYGKKGREGPGKKSLCLVGWRPQKRGEVIRGGLVSKTALGVNGHELKRIRS